MDVYISSGGKQRGPYSLDQVREMRDRSEIAPVDYVWYQGLPAWIPVAQLQPDGSVGPPPLHQKASLRHGASVVLDRVTGRLSSIAGVEKVEGLHRREFFSEVLKKRTDDDIEALFVTGTRTTTPPLDTIDTRWPRPWAFFRALVAAVLLFAGFYYAVDHFQSVNSIPGLILVGSFGIPLATLIFFVEMNVPRNVSLYQVFKLVNAGGLGAIMITLFLGTAFTSKNVWVWAFSTAVVEESAKLLTVIFFMRNRRFIWSLNGLLMGAAVGAGFAAFESAGYALQFLFKDVFNSVGGRETHLMLEVMGMRALLAPAGHVVWTGLATAALWKVKYDKPFSWGMLADQRFYRVFLLVVACHAIWDLDLFDSNLIAYIKYLCLGFVAWVLVLAYIQDGLKQVRQAQKGELEVGNPPVEAAPS
jgi:RsiW-degrading membrane proteinase PrsW (M82 family)